MNKNLYFAELALVLLVIAPQVFSFDCNRLNPELQEACTEIEGSGIEGKDLLIANLAYDSNYRPDHVFAYEWNTGTYFNSTPENVAFTDKTFIKEAWMKIMAVMPSVQYNHTLLVPKTSQVLVGFHYSLVLPEDYVSGGHPENSEGDCKRTYSLMEESSQNRIYADNFLHDTGKLGIINLDRDSTVQSRFSISAKVEVEHYKWVRYCATSGEKGCVRYAYRCTYSSTETVTDGVELADSLEVKLYSNNATASLTAVNSYNGNVKAEINFTDSALFDFGNSEYTFRKYYYDVVPKYPPYHILTLRANEADEEKTTNLHKGEDYVIVSNPETCMVSFWDYFNEGQKPCSTEFESVDLEVRTDKLKYKQGDKIIVSILPDVEVTVTYGDSSLVTSGGAEFVAVASFNKIKASYGDITAEKVVFVSGGNSLLVLWNVAIFTAVIFFVFTVVKRTWKWNT